MIGIGLATLDAGFVARSATIIALNILGLCLGTVGVIAGLYAIAKA